MRIGFCGRLGVYLIVFALAADVCVLHIWRIDVPYWRLWEPGEPPASFPVILFLLGSLLLLRSSIVASREKREASARGIGHVIRMARRHAKLKQPLSNLPSFGLVGASFLALLLFFSLILTRRTPQGLKVDVPKPGTYTHSDEPWNEPMVVRIDARGDLYLNRQPVAAADLEKRLQGALSRRGDWTVFVDGHQGRQYQEIARVVDAIQGAFKAKVILITPGMVEENPMLSKPPFCIPGPREGEKLEVPSPLPAPYRSKIRDYPYTSVYGSLLLVVNERGEVSKIRISHSSGFPAIDAWLMRSAQKWKYRVMPGCGAQEVDFPFQVER